MINLLIIVPYPEMYRTVEEVLARHPLREDLSVTLETRSVDKLSELDLSEYDAVIARGYSAADLETRYPEKTVIRMMISGVDIVRALVECRDLYQPDKIAVCGFQDKLFEVQDLAGVLSVRTEVYRSPSPRDLPEVIRQAQEDGCTALIGGYSANLEAQKAGVPSVVIRTGADTVLKAVDEAVRAVESIRAERLVSQMYKTIIYSSREGILYADRKGIIRVRNRVIRKMNGGQSLLNRTFGEVFPYLSEPFERVLETGQEVAGLIWQLPGSSVKVSASLRPVIVDAEIAGVVVTMTDITEIQQLESQIRRKLNQRGLQAKYRFEDILHESGIMRQTIELAQRYAATDSNIIIVGETGTGKELFAQSIHRASRRSSGPFVVINCAALPENLLESELFGYAEGAFTGAARGGRPGLFEQAHGGTLFLDEIEEIPAATQIKLLRALQERQVRRVGDNKMTDVNVRIITATNRSIQGLLQSGIFRRDLMYRLDVLRLFIPPLRERQEDLEILFSQRIADRYQKEGLTPPAIAEETSELLHGYPFYGNIRELYNVADRISAAYRGPVIDAAVLREALRPQDLEEEPGPASAQENREEDYLRESSEEGKGYLRRAELARMKQALAECGGRKEEAARRLGMHRTTLWRKMKQYGLL